MTDRNSWRSTSLGMDHLVARRIVNADLMNDGVIVQFDDGRCAFYSSAFLYAKLPECEELDEADTQW